MTPRQRDCLRFIESYWAEHDCSPSYDEIHTAIGCTSRSNVHRLVRALEERGHIMRVPHRARSLVPLAAFESAAPPAPRIGSKGGPEQAPLIQIAAAAMRLLCSIVHEDPDGGTALVRADALGDLDIAIAEAGLDQRPGPGAAPARARA